MSYNYATSSKTNPGFTWGELFTAIESFLAYEASWTVHQSSDGATTGVNGSATIIEHDNGTPGEEVFISMWRRTASEFAFNLSTGVTLLANWQDQPGARLGNSGSTDYHCKCNQAIDDIVEYHFFGYPEYFYCVFKTSQGFWRNFGFGHVNKKVNFVGGGFCCASYSTTYNTYEDDANSGYHTQFFDMYSSFSTTSVSHCSQMRIDEADTTLRYALAASSTYTFSSIYTYDIYALNGLFASSGGMNSNSETGYRGFEYPKMQYAPSEFSLTSPLIPIYIYTSGNFDPPRYKSLVAELPHVFGLNIQNLVETSEITVQGEQYVVFPAARKTSLVNDGSNTLNSYYYGFSMLKKVEA